MRRLEGDGDEGGGGVGRRTLDRKIFKLVVLLKDSRLLLWNGFAVCGFGVGDGGFGCCGGGHGECEILGRVWVAWARCWCLLMSVWRW